MFFKRFDNTYVLRVQVKEDIVQAITTLVEDESIKLATVQGIGACDDVEIGLYEVSTASYEKTQLKEELELASLLGNISTKDGKPYIHLHAIFGNGKDKTYCGHLNKAIVSGTAEIFITTINGSVDRKICNDTKLNVFDLE